VQFRFIFHGAHSSWCHLLSCEFNYIPVLLHLRGTQNDSIVVVAKGRNVSVPRPKITAIKLSNLLLRFHCCTNTRSGLDLNESQLNDDDKHRIITQTSLQLRLCNVSLFADQFEISEKIRDKKRKV
jgi:hypothetical protein